MDQLIVALDVPSAAEAQRLADQLSGIAGAFKVGSQLFTAEGPSIVRWLIERDHRVFLDLKFHDIPNTVAQAVTAAAKLGVWMIDVHACGGLEMMQAAATAAHDGAGFRGVSPLVVAITVLTSLDEQAVRQLGISRSIENHVEELASMARQAGLDGVVASPWEVARLRARHDDRFVIVTPGIRQSGKREDDQMRTLGAAEAIQAGASYIVVGRPVVHASDPRRAASELCEAISAGRA